MVQTSKDWLKGRPQMSLRRRFSRFSTKLQAFVAVVVLGNLFVVCRLHKDFPFGGSSSSSSSSRNNIPYNGKPKAVIHAGPHKTGSSIIQNSLSKEASDLLARDNYVMPSVKFRVSTGGNVEELDEDDTKNVAHLAACFNKDRRTETEFLCTPDKEEGLLRDFYQFLDESYSKRQNVLLTSEEFDRPGTDLARLQSLLEPRFDVEIVLYYRPFYTWIASLHNEISKTNAMNHGSPFPTIVEWISKPGNLEYWSQIHTGPTYQRYQARNFSRITVLDLGQLKGKSLPASFVCKGLPNAEHSCAMHYRADLLGEEIGGDVTDSNKSTSLDFYELMGALRKRGYEVTPAAEAAFRSRWDSGMLQPPGEMPRVCLLPQHIDKLYNMSKEYENAVLKGIDAGRILRGGSKFKMLDRNTFNKDVPRLFCSVNAKSIIEDVWISEDWFQPLLATKTTIEPEPPNKPSSSSSSTGQAQQQITTIEAQSQSKSESKSKSQSKSQSQQKPEAQIPAAQQNPAVPKQPAPNTPPAPTKTQQPPPPPPKKQSQTRTSAPPKQQQQQQQQQPARPKTPATPKQPANPTKTTSFNEVIRKTVTKAKPIQTTGSTKTTPKLPAAPAAPAAPAIATTSAKKAQTPAAPKQGIPPPAAAKATAAAK
eukprot:CAMPEP_0172409104 /NCGR_PEP_ID=MMETSP1061-20121228/76188_1 /TAXON_ID=37318 /ORGANISM="Pseudo-nitzschia pungens, Strain cf. pungens" /LENGTH=648 /DNA_ID=CAMNT_0013145251 /DNA_START=321 /DNA_END=2267 /DNA_ORIENTATION=-